MKFDVLVVGDYCFDVILTGLPTEPFLGREIFAEGLEVTIGGATFPTAMALRRLGLQVGIHMQLGSDPLSRLVLEMLTDAGFDSKLLDIHEQPFRRLTVSVSFPEDRGFLSYADHPPTRVDGGRFDGALLHSMQVKHLHFAHLSALLEGASMVEEARALDIAISSDCGWNPTALEHPQVWDRLDEIEVFLPNEQEALYLTGAEDIDRAGLMLAERIPLVVIKYGAQGSIGIQGTQITRMPAIEVDPIETTAAGDCFNAGFLHAYLQGMALDQTLLSGNICGGLSTTASGWQATPTRDELQAWLHK
jgi:sugar/nucleoside kinase (ribokinase family)